MQTFKKEERLSKTKLIDQLFSGGNKFSQPPFRVIWMEIDLESNYPAQVLISVSKKHMKKAVKRNLVKRRIREAYRRNKFSFYGALSEKGKNCILALLYNSKEVASYKDIEEKIFLILQRLQSIDENNIK
jgi:ribonuclease P protein component